MNNSGYPANFNTIMPVQLHYRYKEIRTVNNAVK